jgi:hypothetical protein
MEDEDRNLRLVQELDCPIREKNKTLIITD